MTLLLTIDQWHRGMFEEAERMINAYDPLREERERQERDAVLEVTGPSNTLEFERFRLR
jgi:hypothetical protein